jgi:hypothetical protein
LKGGRETDPLLFRRKRMAIDSHVFKVTFDIANLLTDRYAVDVRLSEDELIRFGGRYATGGFRSPYYYVPVMEKRSYHAPAILAMFREFDILGFEVITTFNAEQVGFYTNRNVQHYIKMYGDKKHLMYAALRFDGVMNYMNERYGQPIPTSKPANRLRVIKVI